MADPICPAWITAPTCQWEGGAGTKGWQGMVGRGAGRVLGYWPTDMAGPVLRTLGPTDGPKNGLNRPQTVPDRVRGTSGPVRHALWPSGRAFRLLPPRTPPWYPPRRTFHPPFGPSLGPAV